MKNAKKEFIKEIEDVGVAVHCAIVIYNGVEYALPVGYTEDDFNRFLDKLAFRYDDGYGAQELFGWIWYKDGTWSDRGEYDGSEWWEIS